MQYSSRTTRFFHSQGVWRLLESSLSGAKCPKKVRKFGKNRKAPSRLRNQRKLSRDGRLGGYPRQLEVRPINTTTPWREPSGSLAGAQREPINRPIVTDFYRFFGPSWETSTQTDSTPEASKRSGSGGIESSLKSTTFLMK